MTLKPWPASAVADIEPCPFCGHPPDISMTKVEVGGGDVANNYKIECGRHPDMVVIAGGLGVHGYRRPDDPPTDWDTMLRVKRAWNQRQSP